MQTKKKKIFSLEKHWFSQSNKEKFQPLEKTLFLISNTFTPGKNAEDSIHLKIKTLMQTEEKLWQKNKSRQNVEIQDSSGYVPNKLTSKSTGRQKDVRSNKLTTFKTCLKIWKK